MGAEQQKVEARLRDKADRIIGCYKALCREQDITITDVDSDNPVDQELILSVVLRDQTEEELVQIGCGLMVKMNDKLDLEEGEFLLGFASKLMRTIWNRKNWLETKTL